MPTREEMRSLAEDIVGSYADRVAGIAEIRAAVKTQLKDFNDAHAAMSQELKADLAKVRPALEQEDRKRQSDTREFMGELGKAVAEGKAEVKAQLKEFDDAHNAMSQELKADLGKICPALKEEDRKRQSEAREFMGELGRTVAEGKAATQALLRNFSEVQAGARDEWQILTATIQAQRAGPAVEVKPSEAVVAPAKEITEEEVAEITPETAPLGDRVFKYLANHPDGTRLVELEQEFGMARIQMVKVVKSLMDENKVEKRELSYFAI